MASLKCKQCGQGRLKLIKEIKNEEMHVEFLNEKKRVNCKIYKCLKCGTEEQNMEILET
jgi:uncharacterized Zn finger protein